MPPIDLHLEQKLADCRELYLKYGGRRHETIEREMRLLGWENFRRRILYTRKERGRVTPGWIEKYGWKEELRNADRGMRIEGKCSVPTVGHEHATDSDGAVKSTNPQSAFRDPQSNDPFRAWLKRVSPRMNWDWKHVQLICKKLQEVTDGTCKRLMISLPPRHGKSELVTVRYTAHRMKCDPSLNVILGSYNQQLANRFSRKIRRVLLDDFAKSKLHSEECRNASSGGCAASQCGEGSGVTIPPVLRQPATGLTGESPLEPSEPAKRATNRLSEAQPPPGKSMDAIGEASLAALHCGEAAAISPAHAGSVPKNEHPNHALKSVAIQGERPDTSVAIDGGEAAAIRIPQSTSSDFPFINQRPKNTEAEWETSKGGGLRAVGVGGGVTGFGANLIIIDDPVKSRAEAESESYRDGMWEWFCDDIYTRLEPNGAVILIQTRWHEDDLAGRLLRKMAEGGEAWDVVSLPALSEPPALAGGQTDNEKWNADKADRSDRTEGSPKSNMCDIRLEHDLSSWPPADAGGSDPLGRAPGEALCPERYDIHALEKLKLQIGSYSFAALYQQRPVPAEGGLFKRHWFKKTLAPPPNLKWKRGYDLGVTKNSTSDYTASLRVAYDKEGNLYIDGGFRRRIEYPEQRRYIQGRIAAEPDTEHGVELSANGSAVVQEIYRDARFRGRPFRGIKVKGDKVSRALSWIALAEAGKVYLVRGAWNEEFIDEACSFPSGAHDDQIDAVSLAVRMHAERKGSFWAF